MPNDRTPSVRRTSLQPPALSHSSPWASLMLIALLLIGHRWDPVRDTRPDGADRSSVGGEHAMSWRIRGTYFESCNCDAICPCRRIDGTPGGRSTYGICMGVLSWLIEEGAVGDVDLSGLPVAIACRYSDDELGSPWTWALYLDARASDDQRNALEGIFTGRLGGEALEHFPWAWKESKLIAVRNVEIDVEHARRRQLRRVRHRVMVRIRDR